MPEKEKTEENSKVLNPDRNGEKIREGDWVFLMVDYHRGQCEGKDQDYQVKQLEGVEENPTAKRNHSENLLELIQSGRTRTQSAR